MKLLNSQERVELTNALQILENHGIIDHANFFTQGRESLDVWAYIIGNKSIRIYQKEKYKFELEVVKHGE